MEHLERYVYASEDPCLFTAHYYGVWQRFATKWAIRPECLTRHGLVESGCGLIGLTLTLAKEVGEHNIQVNAVCPGPVAGERMRQVIEQRAAELGQPPSKSSATISNAWR